MLFVKLLTTPLDSLGRGPRFILTQLRIARQCLRLLQTNRSFTQAAALSYHTIFGIVPLAIVMLMVFQMFPAYQDASEKVKGFFYQQLNLTKIEYPAETSGAPVPVKSAAQQKVKTITIADKINEITEQYLSKLNTGAITIVGSVLVIWAAIALLTTIERAFNNIWRLSRGRDFLHRMISYWAILTLGPILLALGFYLTARFALTSSLETGPLQILKPTLPLLISVTGLFILYFFIPNTDVKVLPAIWGAFVAALLWTFAKYAFGLYITNLIPFQAVYGILGIIPLSVFWIYVTWAIVLFGLQLTYAAQNIKHLDQAELARLRRAESAFIANDRTAVRLMEYILAAFEQVDTKPITITQLSSRLNLPADLTERLCRLLVAKGLLCQTDEPISGYVPSTDGAHIKLSDIAIALDSAVFEQAATEKSDKIDSVFEGVRQVLDRYTLKDVLSPMPQTQSDRKQSLQTDSREDDQAPV